MRYAWKLMLLCVCLLLGALSAYGQNPNTTSFSAADDYGTDVVNLTTLVPTINFLGLPKSQGALPGSLGLASPQACGLQTIVSGTPPVSHTYWICGINYGYPAAGIFPIREEMIGMNLIYTVSSYLQGTVHCNQYAISGIIDIDNISAHRLPNTNVYHPSQCGATTADVITNDGSGYSLHIIAGVSAPTIGTISNASGWSGTLSSSDTVTDPFNNSLTYAFGTSTNTFTDTLGAVTTDTFRNNGAYNDLPDNYAYTDTSGTTRNIAITYGSARNFVPMNAGNCGTQTSAISVTPPVTISYPDGTSVSLGWTGNSSSTTGLINSVTLRSGGTISYSYGNIIAGSLNYCQWAYSSLSRTTSDGTWNYTLSLSNGVTTTTVLDPGNNKTVYTFAGFSGLTYGMPVFLTSVYRYQNTGTVASPVYTLISNTSYCYNNVSCSTAPSYPITQRDTYEYVGTGSTQMSHRVETFDSYGSLLTDANTDSVTNQTITKTIAYGTWNGSACVALSNGAIVDHPCTITVKNGSTQLSYETFTYNSNGAPTASTEWVSSTDTLSTSYSPNSNGTIASVTAPNGQVTTNTYGNCNSLLLTDSTTTVNSVAIDNKATWNCNGALAVDTTDPNGNEDDTTYDSMFRIVSYTDRNEQTTNYSYGTTVDNYFTSTDPLGVIQYRWTDGLGRTTLEQTKQSPSSSNYDTTSIVYQWNGTNFQVQTTVPCVQTYGNGCPATFELTSLVNPIAGPISSTDANNGTVTYGLGFSSSGQDASATAGPAPSGEHTKIAQTERDGFGRIKSTCPLETSGGTSCGQALGNSGILTSASYSFASGSSTATTTRGSQTHTTVADALGRVTSTTTPEAGTVTNYYDSDSYCNLNYKGVLNRTLNNDGSICYYYDSLNRVTDVWVPSSVAGDFCRHFRYDTASNGYLGSAPNGVTVNNGIGRLVEVVTDTYYTINGVYGYCVVPPYNSPVPSQSNIQTDEWFSYDKDGRITDMWESTPHSSGYYHTTTAYDADGTATSVTLAGQCSPTFAYGVDGEDRPNSMSLCGNTTIVSATAGNGFKYDAASRPLNVPIGSSGDQDTYTYDNVGNMTEYTFTVNGTSDDGKLTWNPIGSLQKLVITDGFNSGGSQTCTFGTSTVMGYDDVGRLLDDNCGSSLWHQSYGYDQYDNLTKTGNPGISWNPGYSATNNEMTGSTYDSNGNLTYDGVNSYSWDVYGQMVGTISGNNTISCGTSGSSCATYDAFGKIVESSIGNSYQQMLYSPIGLVAYMNGQSVNTWYVPAPGGGDFFMVSGVTYFLHPDWLRSKRLGTSLVNRSSLFDVAYAPYGDPYDSFTTSWYYTDFTGLTNEWASGIYTTPTRQFTVNSSRWPSPDPAHVSWNAYSYVLDPNTQTDPGGLDPKPAYGCEGWLCWLHRFLVGPAAPDDPPSLMIANMELGTAGTLAWRFMTTGQISDYPNHSNPGCNTACAAAARKGGKGKSGYIRMSDYREKMFKKYGGVHPGDHLLKEVQDMASEYNLKYKSYTKEQFEAANKAIDAFLKHENNMERLIREDSVLSKHFSETMAKSGLPTRERSILDMSYDLSGWDALEEYYDEVTKEQLGTWADVDWTHRLSNGEYATIGEFLKMMKK